MISIVNYGMGNIQSIQGALQYLGFESRVVNTPAQIEGSSKLILPGVGSFAKAMANINELHLLTPLNRSVLELNVPILGICLGMQLLADSGDEDGPTAGLGWIHGNVRRLKAKKEFKIPHIGFNSAYFVDKNSDLFRGLGNKGDFYFIHSYVFDCRYDTDISSWTEYGEKFASSVQHKSIYGTQFHPEKSQSNGLTVLKNFALL
jgi:imidazole glycerol-phosphate synthase subunit HisH